MKTTSCTENNTYAFNKAARCGARTKRNNGSPCRAPAVRGKRRCRIHGGSKGSGGQQSNKNSLKHGYTTAEAKNFRMDVSNALKAAKAIEGLTVSNEGNQDLQ